MNVTIKLQKWGNSSGVRLTKQVIDAANLTPNQAMSVSLRGDSIILTPVRKEEFTLETMLKGVTPEMVGGEFNWGPDVGAEIIDD